MKEKKSVHNNHINPFSRKTSYLNTAHRGADKCPDQTHTWSGVN